MCVMGLCVMSVLKSYVAHIYNILIIHKTIYVYISKFYIIKVK
jgi:hypothetical protein